MSVELTVHARRTRTCLGLLEQMGRLCAANDLSSSSLHCYPIIVVLATRGHAIRRVQEAPASSGFLLDGLSASNLVSVHDILCSYGVQQYRLLLWLFPIQLGVLQF